MGSRRMGRAGVVAVLGVAGLAVAGSVVMTVMAKNAQAQAEARAAAPKEAKLVLRPSDRMPDGTAVPADHAAREVLRLAEEAQSQNLLRRVVQSPDAQGGLPKFMAAHKNERGEVIVERALEALTKAVTVRSLEKTGEVELAVALVDAEESGKAAMLIVDLLRETVMRRVHDGVRERVNLMSVTLDDISKVLDRLRTRRAALVRESKLTPEDLGPGILHELASQELRLSIERTELASRGEALKPGENGAIAVPGWLVDQARAEPALAALRAESLRRTTEPRDTPEAEAAAHEFAARVAKLEVETLQRRLESERAEIARRIQVIERTIEDIRKRSEELKEWRLSITPVHNQISDIDEQIRLKEAERVQGQLRAQQVHEQLAGWAPFVVVGG